MQFNVLVKYFVSFFSSLTVSFFHKYRHSQWALLIIDYKLSDHCAEFDFIHSSMHRSTLSHDLKMPNTFRKRPRQHLAVAVVDTHAKKEEFIFEPFTQAELNEHKTKIHEKAQKCVTLIIDDINLQKFKRKHF